jgi:outer membrane beta-barrel protein
MALGWIVSGGRSNRSWLFGVPALAIALSGFFSANLPSIARADDQAAPKAADAEQGQTLEVDNLKKKYWEKGEDTSLRVVQNRTYSKAKKFELGVFAGTISTDPFLSVKNFGGHLGYFFNEEFGVDFIYWTNFVSGSSALSALQQQTGLTSDTNEPKSFYGGEFTYSPIYGKLSLSGKMIIYYDLFLLAGLGITKTETGNLFTPEIGLGQQFYLAKKTALRIDYRLTFYHENIEDKIHPATLGQIVSSRNTFNNVITLGITQLF